MIWQREQKAIARIEAVHQEALETAERVMELARRVREASAARKSEKSSSWDVE